MKNLLRLLTRKTLWLTTFLFFLTCTTTAPAIAQRALVSYQARLSEADHYNTEGIRLWTIPAIVRQDRANFHNYGIQDFEDEWERLYGNVNNRQALERALTNQPFSRYQRRLIINGTPLIQVTVYPNYVDVTILEE